MSRKVVIPQTEREKQMLGISEEAWSTYNELFIPIEDIWLDTVKPPSESEYARTQGRWTAEAAGTFGEQERQTRQELFAGGIGPGSGAFLSNLSTSAANKGRAAGAAVNEGLNAADMDYYQKAILADKFGQGVTQESIGGLYSGASAEATARRIGEASKANADLARIQNQMGWMDVAGTGLGLATGYGLSKASSVGSNPGDLVVQKSPNSFWETEVGSLYNPFSGQSFISHVTP